MIAPGTIVLFRYPYSDLQKGKFRPAVLLKQIPNEYGDWLVAMVSTQLHQQIEGLEIVIEENDPAFVKTGLKKASLIRTSRLAVVDSGILAGPIGQLEKEKLSEILAKLSNWLME